ncbi:unnamed protein product [Moneuplotes crassus]|uniref:Uncharacterized protein n=1 Tax=Euplotes crassus TaxID=5936 RepID=A0AAD2DBJ9_EUPCR|nr:unnamed protein product [Moneuplotes crassus]
MEQTKRSRNKLKVKKIKEEIKTKSISQLASQPGSHPLMSIFKKTYQNPSDNCFEMANEYDTSANQTERDLFDKISGRINSDNNQINKFEETSPAFYQTMNVLPKYKQSEGKLSHRISQCSGRRSSLGETLSNFGAFKSRSHSKNSQDLTGRNHQQVCTYIGCQTIEICSSSSSNSLCYNKV